MNITKEQVAGIVRALLAYAAGRFAGAQMLNDPMLVEVASTVVLAIVTGWSAKSKKK